MDQKYIRGIRIGPIPQQSGAQTIQQAIYQAHGSPCGINKLVYDPIGITNIRYFGLKQTLDVCLNTPRAVDSFDIARLEATTYLQYASPANRLIYLDALTTWAKKLYLSIPRPEGISGYTYVLTVFDYNGSTIWDSKTPFLLPIITDMMGNAQYNQVTLSPQNPFKTKNGDPVTSTPLYGLGLNQGYTAWITGATMTGDSDDPAYTVQSSAFCVNQATFPETVMATASLLNDPANTRSFGFPMYGFSSRQQMPNQDGTTNYGAIGYYCCLLVNLYTVPNDSYPDSTLIETVVVRLGLEQSPPSGPPPS